MRFLLLILTSFILAAGEPAPAGERLTTADGALSLVVPPNWQTREFPGMRNRVAAAVPVQGFAVNLNIVDEPTPMPITEYQAATQAALARVMSEFKFISAAPFATTAGVQGVRMVTECVQGQFRLRQVFFLLPGRGVTKYVVTCSALAADAATHDPVFAAAASSILIK